jgi:hypothetical protein
MRMCRYETSGARDPSRTLKSVPNPVAAPVKPPTTLVRQARKINPRAG